MKSVAKLIVIRNLYDEIVYGYVKYETAIYGIIKAMASLRATEDGHGFM